MGLFDWLKPPQRLGNVIARELAEVVFTLHPSAKDTVNLSVKDGAVISMDVPTVDESYAGPTVDADRAELVARLSSLVMELSSASPPTAGERVTVMRDRVIWMPSVVTFSPSVP